jgi:hypothetical protein
VTDDNDLSGREIEPAFGRNLPAPHDLVGELRERLNDRVLQLRTARGEVHTREDTYVPIQALAALSEGLTDYGRAFLKVAKETNGFIQDELELAVGEQDGIPLSGMKVPDADGTDIRVDLDKRYSYDIDTGPVMKAAALFTLTNHPGARVVTNAGVLDDVLDLMVAGMETLVATGRFEVQKTKVEQLKTEIARTDPTMASTINVKRSADFRGVKVKREVPK